jgi:hypothetical protein
MNFHWSEKEKPVIKKEEETSEPEAPVTVKKEEASEEKPGILSLQDIVKEELAELQRENRRLHNTATSLHQRHHAHTLEVWRIYIKHIEAVILLEAILGWALLYSLILR